ncbi:hypothetical protein SAMN04487897_107184 [Paenibacillus sp. yr247]|uniref:hypothetical protein n=1 Tax=Paenibacillus sp. yr247 TaxID=1761880 RepID=UPI000882DE85|nr:hypothetical protein [Paenibacillus sp. yr247]SDO04705.1 hypothetical protein SAMN04487897_107184 [Paenibacillus sp. yr247]
MINVIERFLEAEISSQELYEDIHYFITSFHIRNGEFEANEFIIKKMDSVNFIIFPEYVYPTDGHREIPYCSSVYKDDLISKINEHAKTKGFTVKKLK